MDVFRAFSRRLIKFIIQSVIRYLSAANTQPQAVAGKLRTLDCSGLSTNESLTSYLLSDAIVERISNSTMDALRHKVEIITDAGKKKVVEENIATDDFSTIVYYSEVYVV